MDTVISTIVYSAGDSYAKGFWF